MDDNVCPVCLRTFKTVAGKRSHMSSSKSCSWYRFGKLADLRPLDQGDDREGGAMGIQADDGGLGRGCDGGLRCDGGLGRDEDEIDNADVADILGDLLEQEEELFHFVMPSSLQQQNNTDVEMEDGEAGPGPSTLANKGSRYNAPRTLDDSDDNRVEEIHPTAGSIIRMDESLHRRWKKVFGEFCSRDDDNGDIEMLGQEDNRFSPFASELDWRIARWVIKDGPGQNAFDRLLKIPGVCQQFNYLLSTFLIFI